MVERIKTLIEKKRLTSSAFADKLGVPRSRISHILSGRNNPSLELVVRILDAFPEVRTDWLVRGKGSMLSNTHTDNVQTDLFSSQVGYGADDPSDPDDSPGSESQQKVRESVAFERNTSGSSPPDANREDKHGSAEGNEGIHEEMPPFYHRKNSITKIIALHADGTFSAYLPR